MERNDASPPISSLQWGRSGEGAEDGPAASQAVRQGRRFNGAAPVKERKTTPVSGTGLTTLTLQWGRSGEGAEDAEPACILPGRSALQWGRSGEGAEDVLRCDADLGEQFRFNGAAPVKERKTPWRLAKDVRQATASMGPLR